MKSRPLTLSVCMIVRDGAATLERCLASIAPVAEEIVVVDTGSADNSIELAERHDAVIGSFPWCDDFAAARNSALALASSKWVLSIDADEWLPEETQERIRRLKATLSEPWQWTLQAVPVEGPEPDGQILSTITGPRLFPRIGTWWQYRLHEFPTNPRFKASVNQAIRILHDGYEETDQRSERNVRILRAGLAEATTEAATNHYGFFLARYPGELSGLSQEERVQMLERCIVGAQTQVRVEAGDMLTDIYLAASDWSALVGVGRRLGRTLSTYARCSVIRALVTLGEFQAARDEVGRLNEAHAFADLVNGQAATARVKDLAALHELAGAFKP